MLQEKTIKRTEGETFKEPEGEIIDVVDRSSRSITLLTRVDSDKGEDGEAEQTEETKEEKPVPDPSDHTIAELKALFSEREFGEAAQNLMYDMETDGKDRKTAKAAIKDL